MALTRDDFEYWLFDMDQELSAFLDSLPGDVSDQLDYSASSLISLEGWVLARYSSITEILKESEKQSLDRLARYVGETLRKCVGGTWNIDLEDNTNAYFELPVVEQRGQWTECPVSMVTAATDRRTGNYMEGIVRWLASRHGGG